MLELLDHAVWITEPEEARIVWANPPALALWMADSPEELFSRNMAASETVRVTLLQLRERVRRGERIRSERTIYPKGFATPIQMSIGPFQLADGRMALIVEGIPAREKPDPERLRWAEAARYSPVAVTTHGLDGATLSANTLAREMFGLAFSLADLFVDSADLERVLSTVAAGTALSQDAELRTALGVRIFDVETRPIPDPVTGAPAILLNALDITARREAERAKDELLSVVNHELRTPLTAVRGALSLLSHHDSATEEERAELLDLANQNATRLMRLINDLLDVRKLAEGALELHRKPSPLGPIVQQAVDLQRSLAAASSVRLHTASGPAGSLLVLVDPDRILQVVANLVSNALKHAPRDTDVEVSISHVGSCARVAVRDHGAGVPTEFLKRLFSRFSQAD
ncbi:MAG: histidine kinase dimerization/phospho-acceptor domain-containing protein, partial [Polyangiaceae bacterium]